MRYTVELTTTARTDLFGLYAYIKNVILDTGAAKNQVARIREAVFSLGHLPERFPLIPREIAGDRAIHKISVDNYIVFYQIQPTPPRVYVLRVVYCRRNWLALLKDGNSGR